MPLAQLGRFVESAVAKTRYVTLGLDAGIAPRQRHSSFSQRVMYAPTLNQSLQSVCRNSTAEDTSAKFRLVRDRDHAWVQCGVVSASAEAIRQIETYRYSALLEIVRTAAGQGWTPELVHFQHSDDGGLDGADLLKGVDIRYGMRGLAFAFNPALLGKSMFDVPSVPVTKAEYSKAPLELPQALTEIVRTQMLAKKAGIEQLAGTLGLTKRTFQRRLSENGLTYSKLLEFVRVDTAKHWLEDEGRSLSDIAADLGYRHSTHFGRAFHRVCGVTPKEYRSMAKHG